MKFYLNVPLKNVGYVTEVLTNEKHLAKSIIIKEYSWILEL